MYLHQTIFIYNDGKLVCRGAGDSHLPRSLRARSPHVLSPRRRFQPLTDKERSSESRRGSASPQGIPPEFSNLINQVLAIEWIGPLRRGISCYARPTYAVGSRQMQCTCTMILKKNTANLVFRGAGDSHLPRSMRARSPHGLFSPAAVPTAKGREAKLREPTGTVHDRREFRRSSRT